MAEAARKLDYPKPDALPENLSPEQEMAAQHWINEARVRAHGGEERPVSDNVRRAQTMDSVKPVLSGGINTRQLPLQPTQRITEEELERMNAEMNAAVAREGWVSRRLRRLRETKQKLAALSEEAGAKGKMSAAINRYKRIKRLVQVVKIASAAGASLGDILVSAGTFLVTAHLEWIYSKFNVNYPFAPWERKLVIFVDIIIFLELLALAAILTVIYQQLYGGGALKIFGL